MHAQPSPDAITNRSINGSRSVQLLHAPAHIRIAVQLEQFAVVVELLNEESTAEIFVDGCREVILERRRWKSAELENENRQWNNPNEERNAMRKPLRISESNEQGWEQTKDEEVGK